MGWWSDDVMGGDTPLDIQSIIYEASGVNQYPEDSDEEVKISSDGFDYKKIIAFTTKDDDYWLKGDTGNIFHQVLGVMMMVSGAPINKTLKAKMIKAAQQDEWANEDGGDEDRKDKMDAFITTLKAYDGTSTIIKSAGLMEKIADALMPEIPTIEDAVNDNDISVDTLRQLILAHVDDYRHNNVNSLLDKLIEVTNK